MSDRPIPFKNRWTAGILAFLIPGAGHLYQGRLFKGVLYLACILGTFLYGMHLAEWRAVYFQQQPGKRNFGFFAQLGVGGFGLPAFVQASRYKAPGNVPQHGIDEPLSAPFEGMLYRIADDAHEQRAGRLSGRVELEPFHGTFRGTFTGTLSRAGGEAEPIELELGNAIELGRKIEADPRRDLRAEVVEGRRPVGAIIGTIPRRFVNWFEAPLGDEVREELNGRLGKTFELALVFTWIAGLLNILSVWDAVEGPAYGYGDEEQQPERNKTESAATETQSAPTRAAAAAGPEPGQARQKKAPPEPPDRDASSAEAPARPAPSDSPEQGQAPAPARKS